MFGPGSNVHEAQREDSGLTDACSGEVYSGPPISFLSRRFHSSYLAVGRFLDVISACCGQILSPGSMSRYRHTIQMTTCQATSVEE